jgi:hypothetical protein
VSADAGQRMSCSCSDARACSAQVQSTRCFSRGRGRAFERRQLELKKQRQGRRGPLVSEGQEQGLGRRLVGCGLGLGRQCRGEWTARLASV